MVVYLLNTRAVVLLWEKANEGRIFMIVWIREMLRLRILSSVANNTVAHQMHGTYGHTPGHVSTAAQEWSRCAVLSM